MSNEFQEKLQLYKEGKLDRNEAAEIECEIDKFTAIMDYINDDDKAFLEELKQQMPAGNEEENGIAKLLKRKVNLRIIMMTALTVFSAFIIFIFIYFSASKIVSSLFGLNHKELYVKRATMVQFAQMFQPKYKSNRSGVSTSLFAQQNISVSLDNTLGHTVIDETSVSVRYSFGKPVRSGTTVVPPLIFDDFPYPLSHEPDPVSGFKVLRGAPQGTKAKIFVEFNKAITPEQLKEHFINQISNIDTEPLDITPLAAAGSKFVLANPSYFFFTPFWPYDKSIAEREKLGEYTNLKQNQYDNMNSQAHKESFIGNLNLIKNNKRLLQVMYYDDMLNDVNIDDIIKHVENKGVEYVGMYISADSKELLNLKDSPLIHCMRVQNIVIW